MPTTSVISIVLQCLLAALFLVLVLSVILRLLAHLQRQLQEQQGSQQDLIALIDDLLPQTQCGRCSFEGCLPYAEAIAEGEAINKCPPGGDLLIARLGRLLHEHEKSLDPAHGSFTPAQVAVIREEECIGCTKCIRACPVDAILGGPKLMHTVIASECTGCDLCLQPCPVDCIDLITLDNMTEAVQPDNTASLVGAAA